MNRVATGAGAIAPKRVDGWTFAAAAATLAAVWWLRAPGILPLLAMALGLVAASGLVIRRQAARGRAIAATIALGGTFVSLVAGQRAQSRALVNPDAVRAERDSAAMAALRDEFGVWEARLAYAARAALDAPNDQRSTFNALDLLPDGAPEAGVVLLVEDRPVAWNGTIRVPLVTATARTGIVVSPFYVALYVSESRSNRRAIATVLLHAEPPASRFAPALDRLLATRAGIRGFTLTRPDAGSGFTTMSFAGLPVVSAAPVPLTREELLLRATERARAAVGAMLALAMLLVVAAEWHREATLGRRLGTLGLVTVATAAAPLSAYSNVSRVFNPGVYFAQLGGPLTASLAPLLVTSAALLLALLAVRGGQRRDWPRAVGFVAVVVLAALGPYLLRDLSRGIAMPTGGATIPLWIVWQGAIFLAAMTLLVAAAAAGRVALGRRTGISPWVAPVLALCTAAVGPAVWEAPSGWPWLYVVPWILAVAALAMARRSTLALAAAGIVAATGALTLVWGSTVRARVAMASADVGSLRGPDPNAAALLERFGAELTNDPPGASREALLARYASADLVTAGYPLHLAVWAPGRNFPVASLSLAPFSEPLEDLRTMVDSARSRSEPQALLADVAPWHELAIAVPHADGSVTTAVVAPRTRLIADEPWALLLGLTRGGTGEAPYQVIIGDAAGSRPGDPPRWTRRGDELHGDWIIEGASGPLRVHSSVELRSTDSVLQRGVLLVLLDLLIVGVLWALEAAARGGLWRWGRMRRRAWLRSYRARLTVVLFAFAVVPVVGFAVWSVRRLRDDDRRSRELVVQELLRNAMAPGQDATLEARALRADAPLLVYRDGELFAASEPLFSTLAPAGRYLAPSVQLDLEFDAAMTATTAARVGRGRAILGFRGASPAPVDGRDLVIAAPARADEPTQDRRRDDLLVLVIVAAVTSALGAWWLSGVAAQVLAAPIGALRRAASAVASGAPIGLPSEPPPPVEFASVFASFDRMASDLTESRGALEEAQRRTAAVLRTVASGVVAIAPDETVTLANPRAEALLGAAIPAGTPLAHFATAALATRVRAFAANEVAEVEFALEDGTRQLRARLARLRRGGVVLTLDDVTQLARAQRVLAWGEMARQVAHEIKNPLTPIRLGVQHLRRAYADGRPEFPQILDDNVTRILAEIDHLDEIARAFSRYGTPAGEGARPKPVDVAAEVRDVIGLETMGETGMQWRAEGAERPAWALAQAPELREVLINLLENARHARAGAVSVRIERAGRLVVLRVRDDGEGIHPDVLPRVFEPHFSTTTSGSGLGLAISRRLVEGWGGTIALESAVGAGTTVTVTLAATLAPGEVPS